jgi:translation initiation factor 3 subunit D
MRCICLLQLAKTQGNVFATDSILATIMCCTRSSYSWDIVVQRVGNKLFFDKRDDSDFDLLTVSETATEPPQDEGNSINSPRNLALEATFINHNFSQQVLKAVRTFLILFIFISFSLAFSDCPFYDCLPVMV